MTSRDAILRRLRAVKPPYADEPPPAEYLPVVPLDASDRAALIDRFVTKAEALSSVVHRCASEEQARATVLDIISPDDRVLCWDFVHIPLPGLAEALDRAGIAIAPPDDASVRVGITGAERRARRDRQSGNRVGRRKATPDVAAATGACRRGARRADCAAHGSVDRGDARAGDNAFTDPSSIVTSAVKPHRRHRDGVDPECTGRALHIVLIES